MARSARGSERVTSLGMTPIPDPLRHRPFTRAEALQHGLTSRMLDGARFVRIYPRVYRARDHVMSDDDWRAAASLALPPHAHLTGLSRLQQCGLELGPRFPIRFVVEGDLHLAFDHVFLHRTKKLPPTDPVGVTVAAAFIAFCARARTIDAIKAGDWLLNHGQMTIREVRDLALAELWRPGSHEAIWVLPHLDARSRSLKESEARAILEFAGLPRPEVNVAVQLDGLAVVVDLLYRVYRTVVEYEGNQHQVDRGTYRSDLDRYALMRDAALSYVQATHETLRSPRHFVALVHRQLVRGGYDGPPPRFHGQWELLFARLYVAVGPRDHGRRPRLRAGGGSATS